MRQLTVLIPTFERETPLAITLTSLISQNFKDFNVYVSDQSLRGNLANNQSLKSLFKILEKNGHDVKLFTHAPPKGLAEHRQFLLDKVKTKYCLFLDDDLVVEPFVIEGMIKVIKKENLGFVGRAPIGLSFKNDIRPIEQRIEFWRKKVEPEKVSPLDQKWTRYKLHNAANILHIQEKFSIHYPNQLKYKIAWVGACAMYDTEKLRGIGGFGFWKYLPKNHCGEDVLVQLKLMEKWGGCGLLPSGVYHQELPTKVPDRSVNAPFVLLR